MGWHPASGNTELSASVISYNLTKNIWFSGILLPAYIMILPHCCESLESQYLIIWATDKVVMYVHHGPFSAGVNTKCNLKRIWVFINSNGYDITNQKRQWRVRWHDKFLQILQKLLLGVVYWFICKSFRYYCYHRYVFWRRCWEKIRDNHFSLIFYHIQCGFCVINDNDKWLETRWWQYQQDIHVLWYHTDQGWTPHGLSTIWQIDWTVTLTIGEVGNHCLIGILFWSFVHAVAIYVVRGSNNKEISSVNTKAFSDIIWALISPVITCTQNPIL